MSASDVRAASTAPRDPVRSGTWGVSTRAIRRPRATPGTGRQPLPARRSRAARRGRRRVETGDPHATRTPTRVRWRIDVSRARLAGSQSSPAARPWRRGAGLQLRRRRVAAALRAHSVRGRRHRRRRADRVAMARAGSGRAVPCCPIRCRGACGRAGRRRVDDGGVEAAIRHRHRAGHATTT